MGCCFSYNNNNNKIHRWTERKQQQQEDNTFLLFLPSSTGNLAAGFVTAFSSLHLFFCGYCWPTKCDQVIVMRSSCCAKKVSSHTGVVGHQVDYCIKHDDCQEEEEEEEENDYFFFVSEAWEIPFTISTSPIEIYTKRENFHIIPARKSRGTGRSLKKKELSPNTIFCSLSLSMSSYYYSQVRKMRAGRESFHLTVKVDVIIFNLEFRARQSTNGRLRRLKRKKCGIIID